MKRIISRTLPVALMILALLVTAAISCGTRKGDTSANARISAHDSTTVVNGVRSEQSLDKALAELDKLAMPPQADPQIWAALKSKLAKLLTDKLGSGKSAMKYVPGYDPNDPTKTSASKDYVKPRNLHWEADTNPNPSAYGKLVWLYVNDGDYDQNGTVGVEDISQLAIHLGPGGTPKSIDGDDTILELIDEDGKYCDGDTYVEFNENVDYDGVNDSTADDVDTIAWNFGVDVYKYEVYGTNTPIIYSAGRKWTKCFLRTSCPGKESGINLSISSPMGTTRSIRLDL